MQHWYTYLFLILACFALLGVYLSAKYQLTHRMIYAMFIFCIWASLTYWNWV